jgi:hypothetical protein
MYWLRLYLTLSIISPPSPNSKSTAVPKFARRLGLLASRKRRTRLHPGTGASSLNGRGAAHQTAQVDKVFLIATAFLNLSASPLGHKILGSEREHLKSFREKVGPNPRRLWRWGLGLYRIKKNEPS